MTRSAKIAIFGIVGILGISGIVVAIPAVDAKKSVDHLQSIQAHQPKYGKIRYLSFRNWYFRLGQPIVGRKFDLTVDSRKLANEPSPALRNLSNRVNWLWSIEHGSGFNSQISYQVKDGGKNSIGQLFLVYGVRTLEVTDAHGKPKFYALNVDSTVIPSIVEYETDPPPWPKLTGPEVSREDFINPQDVDWLFGVKDFTKGPGSKDL